MSIKENADNKLFEAEETEEIKFRVIDADTGEIVGYEYYNTFMSTGSYYVNVDDIDPDDGTYIIHTDWNGEHKLRPSHPLGKLIREQYLGVTDEDGMEIYSRRPMYLLETTVVTCGEIVSDVKENMLALKNRIFYINILVFILLLISSLTILGK